MDLKGHNAVYYNPVMKEAQRLLSWQDREPFSRTYGSFDRTYWGWKFTDFPGARFQEGVYALAHLYTHPFDGNSLAGNERVLEWARAGMCYWASIQYKDGSFDEAYPFERSLAAAAFTGFYAGEAFLLIKDLLGADERERLQSAFIRAGEWLISNDEGHGFLSNHLAAAAAALLSIHRITGDERYKKRCDYFLEKILSHQSEEGWYDEYGGADPGYQTHGTFYLAWIWKHTKEGRLLESLKRSVGFLKYFIHPNGTLGGEYGSRNTEFYFPAGFEILSASVPDAALIASFMRKSVEARSSAGLSAMDAYNFLPMLNNYLFAAENAAGLVCSPEKMPFGKEGERFFPDAGLYVRTTRAYHAVLGLSKGGVLRVYDGISGGLLASDSTYWAAMKDDSVCSPQSLSRPGRWKEAENGFTIESDFIQVKRHVQTPVLFMGFRGFTLTIGRVSRASYWMKNLLVNALIKKRRRMPLKLRRQVRFEPLRVVIEDRIELTGAAEVKELRRGEKFSTIHMGSSRYFQHQELFMECLDGRNLRDELMRERAVTIRSTIPAQGDSLNVKRL